MATRQLRADAARNRDRLLATAAELFGERGLDVPMEEIARRAGVSIGTLYNHFPSREALYDAILPERLGALERLAAAALAEDDPWTGFAGFVEGLIALQAGDRGLNDAIARQYLTTDEVRKVCGRGLERVNEIIARASRAGRLRADFEPADLVMLVWGMSQVIRESAEVAPAAWRRCLRFYLDGLRAEAAAPTDVPALTTAQLAAIARP